MRNKKSEEDRIVLYIKIITFLIVSFLCLLVIVPIYIFFGLKWAALILILLISLIVINAIKE